VGDTASAGDKMWCPYAKRVLPRVVIPFCEHAFLFRCHNNCALMFGSDKEIYDAGDMMLIKHCTEHIAGERLTS
jgi:hypothetical protein